MAKSSKVYYSVQKISHIEKITFVILKSLPHVRAWWEGYWQRYTTDESTLIGGEPTWASFVDALKEEFYHVENYDGQYMRWTTLCQKRDCVVSEYTNIFHTLHSKLGIKDFERHLVLKYRSGIHRYIQTEMDFLDISSLGVSYRYAVKIEKKFKQQSKWEKHGKGNSNSHNEGQSKEGKPQEIRLWMQAKKGNGKSKKDTRKWCDFHNIPWNNTDEYRSIQSLVAELKDKYPNPDLDPDLENDQRRQIIDAEPTAIITTTTIQPEEDPEEGERLFHSQMWVKGTPLHFIVDSRSQKNIISAKVVKQLDFPTTPHSHPYNIGWLYHSQYLHVSQKCLMYYDIKPFKDEILCDVKNIPCGAPPAIFITCHI
jgi:hypothetical protein